MRELDTKGIDRVAETVVVDIVSTSLQRLQFCFTSSIVSPKDLTILNNLEYQRSRQLKFHLVCCALVCRCTLAASPPAILFHYFVRHFSEGCARRAWAASVLFVPQVELEVNFHLSARRKYLTAVFRLDWPQQYLIF